MGFRLQGFVGAAEFAWPLSSGCPAVAIGLDATRGFGVEGSRFWGFRSKVGKRKRGVLAAPKRVNPTQTKALSRIVI